MAREDLQPNPRCEETKSGERVARSMVVCIKWRWIRSSARLTVQLRARAVFLLYGDIHIHGCVLPPPYGVLWLCSVDIIALIAMFFLEHQCCLLVVMELLASA